MTILRPSDLVDHGANAFMVNIDDADGLAYLVPHMLQNVESLQSVPAERRKTAERHSYAVQEALWRPFFDGFAQMGANAL